MPKVLNAQLVQLVALVCHNRHMYYWGWAQMKMQLAALCDSHLAQIQRKPMSMP
jgi:hypothetical protein